VDGFDIINDYRAARSKIGLVPQELFTDAFESVWATVSFSRGLFGKPPNDAYLEQLLRDLSLWDKKDARLSPPVGRHEAPGDDRQGAERTSRASCFSTSQPPASTSSCAATCGRWSASCASAASPSS
jgi:hypothetical protein